MEIEAGYEIVQDETAPKGRRIIKKGKEVEKEVTAKPKGIGTDSGSQFSDAQLRDAIKQATGKAPGGRASRETLIAQYNELNAEG